MRRADIESASPRSERRRRVDGEGTYVHHDGVVDGFGGREETDSHAGGEDFGKAVQPDNPAYLWLIPLKGEVRRRPRLSTKVKVVVRVVCSGKSIS